MSKEEISFLSTSRIIENEEISTFSFPCIKCKGYMNTIKKPLPSYPDPNYQCNGCGRIENYLKKGMLHCKNCFFDLCSKCRFCPKGHFLKKVFKVNLEDCPKEFRLYPKDTFNCDVCKKFYQNNPGLYKCWPCGYDVCRICILKSKGKI
jgi:hypothetical protein